MNRKLLMLNILLVATAVYAGFQFHNQRVAARAREGAQLNQKPAAAPPPPLPALAKQPVLQPSSYIDVARKDLFDPSRNPDVPIEVPPPPPPPKTPPALPSYYGMMNIGDGYIVIMSKSGSGEQQEVRAGQMIGEFKLVDFTPKELIFEWEGQTIHKRIDEIARASNSNNNNGGEQRVMPGVAPPPQPPPVMVEKGPGNDVGLGGGTRPCQAGDSSAPGAVQDGYHKVVIPGPFGNTCYWAPVK